MTEGLKARFVSIVDAATYLGVKPWDVVRLIESQRVDAVQMVVADSLARYRKEFQ